MVRVASPGSLVQEVIKDPWGPRVGRVCRVCLGSLVRRRVSVETQGFLEALMSLACLDQRALQGLLAS